MSGRGSVVSGFGGVGVLSGALVDGAGAVLPPVAGAVYCDDELEFIVEELEAVESVAFISPCFEQAAKSSPSVRRTSVFRIGKR